jgi:hypothetical protein
LWGKGWVCVCACAWGCGRTSMGPPRTQPGPRHEVHNDLWGAHDERAGLFIDAGDLQPHTHGRQKGGGGQVRSQHKRTGTESGRGSEATQPHASDVSCTSVTLCSTPTPR